MCHSIKISIVVLTLFPLQLQHNDVRMHTRITHHTLLHAYFDEFALFSLEIYMLPVDNGAHTIYSLPSSLLFQKQKEISALFLH